MLCGLGYAVLVTRTCDEIGGVTRGSFPFRLCGLSSEPIAAVPVVAPIASATYSRRLADGMKPGLTGLKYRSTGTVDEIRSALTTFLSSRGFALARREDPFEWWSDKSSEIGFSVRSTGDGRSDVEVIHNTGFE